MKLSIVIAVLESYEVVKRQILHFQKMQLPDDIEVIFVDDGSDPGIELSVIKNIYVIKSYDTRPWSQPCARNFGASKARGDYLLFTDIDHILSKEAILAAAEIGVMITSEDYDKMIFPRHWGVLTKEGDIDQSKQILFDYGLQLPVEVMRERGLHGGCHPNTFSIKADIFWRLDGYDERYCGRYGGDDVDFSKRYGHLCRKLHEVKPHIEGPRIWVYPDARRDKKQMLHSIRRKIGRVERVDPVCPDCELIYNKCVCYYPKELSENESV